MLSISSCKNVIPSAAVQNSSNLNGSTLNSGILNNGTLNNGTFNDDINDLERQYFKLWCSLGTTVL